MVVHDRPGERASWEPPGEPGRYIGPSMEQYRCHRSYITKTRVERIYETVEPPLKNFTLPNMYLTDAEIHVANYLIHALNYPETSIPLVKMGDKNTSALR